MTSFTFKSARRQFFKHLYILGGECFGKINISAMILDNSVRLHVGITKRGVFGKFNQLQ